MGATTTVFSALFNMKPEAAGMVIQNLLDMLPELLFVLIYCTILFSWIEIYTLTKSTQRLVRMAAGGAAARRRRQAKMMKKPIIAIFLTALGMLFVLGIQTLMVGLGWETVFKAKYVNMTISQCVVLAVFIVLGTIGFLIFSALLIRQMRKLSRYSASGGSVMKKSAIKCGILAFIFCLALIIRLVYTLWLQGSIQQNIKDKNIRYILWFVYFIVTEHVPLLLVVFVTRTFATAAALTKLKLFKKRKSGYHNLLETTSTGLHRITETDDKRATDSEIERMDSMLAETLLNKSEVEEAAAIEASKIVADGFEEARYEPPQLSSACLGVSFSNADADSSDEGTEVMDQELLSSSSFALVDDDKIALHQVDAEEAADRIDDTLK